MTAPSALPGLNAIRSAPDGYGDDGAAVWAITAPQRDALVAAVEALVPFASTTKRRLGGEEWVDCDLCGYTLRSDGTCPVECGGQTARAALAPFRTRDVTADEVPQKLLDDVRAAGLATAHLGDEVWGGEDR